jgi:N-formylmaleamate deformylase
VNSGVCRANGTNIHYLRTGGGRPAVVLLHGLLGSGACWMPIARMLEADFDVVMPDARGHGESAAPQHGYRYDDLANDVVGLVRGLDLSRPVLIGHSMGGMTAAVAASRCAVRGLVLIDPTFLSVERQREVRDSDVVGEHRRMLGLERAVLIEQAHARHPQRSVEIRELQAEARQKTHISAFEVLADCPNYRDVVSAIRVPSLLVIGDTNPVVTLEMANELCSLNPHVAVEQITSAGHGVPFDQPDRLARVVLAFTKPLALGS